MTRAEEKARESAKIASRIVRDFVMAEAVHKPMTMGELADKIEQALISYGNARLEEAERVATAYAIENGPSHVYTMGGHAIAKNIRALKEKE